MSLFYGFEVKDIKVKDNPTDDKDIVNKKYADTKLALSGGKMKGDIDMSYWALKNIPAAINNGDPISKQFLEGNYFTKRIQSGFAQMTINGDTWVQDSSLHSGWLKSHHVNASRFRLVIDGMIIDTDKAVNANYDFKVRLLVYDDGEYRNEFFLDAYDSTNSKMIKILTPPANLIGRSFCTTDGSNPSLDVDLLSRKAVCIRFQMKEASGTDGNEVWVSFHFEY